MCFERDLLYWTIKGLLIMTIHKSLNQQSLAREIAARSRIQRYWDSNITENEANRFLDLLFEILEETLTTPGGKVSLSRLGIIEARPRLVGGALCQGSGVAETIQCQTYTLQYRPAKRLKALLKQNVERVGW
jgi:nucleoid DNA-binding protein